MSEFAKQWQPLMTASFAASADKAIAKQTIKAQQDENEANRDYNRRMAFQQNQWNLQQWKRENAALIAATNDERAYNSPAAQKGRLMAAGLNPDMMYGGSGISNISSAAGVASSPQMTSGAPSSPVDWSSLANVGTVGQALNNAINMRMADAQIENVKAQTKKTLADAGLSEISLEYADAEKRLGLKMSQQEFENCKQDYELALQAIERNKAELEGVTLDNAYKAIRNAFESELMQTQINLLAEELKIKKIEAEHFLEYYCAQLLGIQADNAWKDAAWIVEQHNGTATAIKYGSEAVTKLVDSLMRFIPKKSKR